VNRGGPHCHCAFERKLTIESSPQNAAKLNHVIYRRDRLFGNCSLVPPTPRLANGYSRNGRRHRNVWRQPEKHKSMRRLRSLGTRLPRSTSVKFDLTIDGKRMSSIKNDLNQRELFPAQNASRLVQSSRAAELSSKICSGSASTAELRTRRVNNLPQRAQLSQCSPVGAPNLISGLLDLT